MENEAFYTFLLSAFTNTEASMAQDASFFPEPTSGKSSPMFWGAALANDVMSIAFSVGGEILLLKEGSTGDNRKNLLFRRFGDGFTTEKGINT